MLAKKTAKGIWLTGSLVPLVLNCTLSVSGRAYCTLSVSGERYCTLSVSGERYCTLSVSGNVTAHYPPFVKLRPRQPSNAPTVCNTCLDKSAHTPQAWGKKLILEGLQTNFGSSGRARFKVKPHQRQAEKLFSKIQNPRLPSYLVINQCYHLTFCLCVIVTFSGGKLF